MQRLRGNLSTDQTWICKLPDLESFALPLHHGEFLTGPTTSGILEKCFCSQIRNAEEQICLLWIKNLIKTKCQTDGPLTKVPQGNNHFRRKNLGTRSNTFSLNRKKLSHCINKAGYQSVEAILVTARNSIIMARLASHTSDYISFFSFQFE